MAVNTTSRFVSTDAGPLRPGPLRPGVRSIVCNCQVVRRSSHRRANRRCLSLLEIIVALAILVGGSALLGQLVNVGRRHSERSVEVTDAQSTAHNLLAELLSGIRPWETTSSPTPVDFWSPWNFAIVIEPVGLGELTSVTVLITERPETELESGTTQPATTPQETSTLLNSRDLTQPPAYKLTRWVRRPMPNETTSGFDSESFEPTRATSRGGPSL